MEVVLEAFFVGFARTERTGGFARNEPWATALEKVAFLPSITTSWWRSSFYKSEQQQQCKQDFPNAQTLVNMKPFKSISLRPWPWALNIWTLTVYLPNITEHMEC